MRMCEAQVAAGGADYSHWVPLVAGLLVILGHSFTCFAGFRGGKGVLAALGVFLAISPLTVLCAFALWIILTVTTKYVSVGSIFGCGLLGALSIFGYVCPEYYFESINLGQMILAVIVAVPSATAVTEPSEPTEATSSSLLDQVTVLLVALSGITVAFRVSLSPGSR